MKEVTPKTVADKYGVNLILTGSLQHMGSTRLLVLNLLNAANGQQVKTAEVSIDADELFQGHDLIRTQALELLGWTVPEELTAKFMAQRPQLDGAFKEYVQGRGYLYRFDQVGNLDKALETFERAIEIDPNYENAYVGLAEAQLRKFLKTGETLWLETMDNVISKLSQISPQNTQVKFLSAELAMKKGEYETAIQLYQESVDQNPNHALSQIGLAKAFYKNGNKAMAENIYQIVSQSEPNNWRVISGFGIFYFQVSNYQGALEQFKLLSEMSPNNDVGVRNMAAAYYSLGDIENAIVYTKQAIELNPSDRAYSNLGTMLFYIKSFDEAIEAYRKAVELQNTYYVHWGNLGDAYRMTKSSKAKASYQKAVGFALEALDLNPNDTTLIADLAYYYANTDQKDLSLMYAKQIGEGHSATDNFMVATAYEVLGDTDMVLNHLTQAINKNYPLDEILNTPLLESSRKDIRFAQLTTDL